MWFDYSAALSNYDSQDQVASGKKYFSDGTAVGGYQFLYSFDQIGNRTTAKNFRGGGTKTSVYTPNDLNQYTSRTVPSEVFVTGTAVTNATVAVRITTNDAAVPAQRHGTYFWKALDADNSSAVYTTTNIQARAYMTSGTNSLVRLETRKAIVPKTPEYFEHDLDGNQTESGLYTNTWDANNRLVCVESKSTVPDAFRVRVDYQYDHRGRMFSRVVQSDYSGGAYQTTNAHILIWDGWNIIGEIIDGTTSNWFTYGPDVSGTLDGAGGVGGLLIVTLDSTNDYLVAFDGNGNVMALIDADDGSVAGEYEYGPFNEPLKVEGQAAQENPIRFSTKYWDTQTRILFYPLRPMQDGRFMCRDRIGESGGVNLYGFLDNDSVNYQDLLGWTSIYVGFGHPQTENNALLWAKLRDLLVAKLNKFAPDRDVAKLDQKNECIINMKWMMESTELGDAVAQNDHIFLFAHGSLSEMMRPEWKYGKGNERDAIRRQHPGTLEEWRYVQTTKVVFADKKEAHLAELLYDADIEDKTKVKAVERGKRTKYYKDAYGKIVRKRVPTYTKVYEKGQAVLYPIVCHDAYLSDVDELFKTRMMKWSNNPDESYAIEGAGFMFGQIDAILRQECCTSVKVTGQESWKNWRWR